MPTRTPREAAVAAYVEAVSLFKSDVDLTAHIPEAERRATARQMMDRAMDTLLDARIISLPAEWVCQTYEAVERHLAKQGGLSYVRNTPTHVPVRPNDDRLLHVYTHLPLLPDGEVGPNREQMTQYHDVLQNSYGNIEFPPSGGMPFPQVLLTWDRPVGLTNGQTALWLVRQPQMRQAVMEQNGAAAWYAMLLNLETGFAVNLASLSVGPQIYNTMIPVYVHEGGWILPQTLMPWMVEEMQRTLMSKRTLMVEGTGRTLNEHLEHRLRRLARRRRLSFRPPRYYEIAMQDSLRAAPQEREEGTGHTHHYRYDVRAHEAIRIQRGPLPLDEKTRKMLLRPRRKAPEGYHIYENGAYLNPDDAERLSSKLLAPYRRGEEWIAILASQVKAHQRGPEDAPYIPAVRRVHDP